MYGLAKFAEEKKDKERNPVAVGAGIGGGIGAGIGGALGVAVSPALARTETEQNRIKNIVESNKKLMGQADINVMDLPDYPTVEPVKPRYLQNAVGGAARLGVSGAVLGTGLGLIAGHNQLRNKMMDREATNNRYGLTKIAWTKGRLDDAFQKAKDAAGPDMPLGEFVQLRENLWNQHNLTPQFAFTNFENSRYLAPEEIKMLKNQGEGLMLPSEGLIQSNANRESLYHEVGHAKDPNFMKDRILGTRALQGGAVVGTGAGIAAPLFSRKKEEDGESGNSIGRGLAVGLGGAGIGGGLAYYGGKKIEQTEDRANDFVKKQLAQDLGSAQAAEETFAKSQLPHARNTYRHATGIQARNTAIGGLAGTGVGLGIQYAANKIKDNKQNN